MQTVDGRHYEWCKHDYSSYAGVTHPVTVVTRHFGLEKILCGPSVYRYIRPMRSSWSGRVFAALFAFWFAFSLAEPAALHSCPMHGAGAASVHAHGAVAHHATGIHGSSNSDHAAKHCTCLGSCCASSANAAVPGAGVSVETVAAYATERHVSALRARAIAAPPFFLPYANGPPGPATVA